MKKLPSKPDIPLIVAIFALLMFGIVTVFDVSIVYASDVFGGKYYFLILQLLWVLVGLVGFGLGAATDYHRLGRLSLPLFLLSLMGLILVILPTPFSPLINGARRWVFINPEPLPRLPLVGRIGFQPSELVKLSFVLYLSYLLSLGKKVPLLTVVTLLLLVLGLVLLQPDMGTAVLISAAGLAVFFVSGANVLYFLLGLPLAAIVFLGFVLASPYRRERLLTYLNHKPADESFIFGAGYHINQILIALGSGGLFGVGFGQSRQKFAYIPEPQTDSVAAILGEELGFLGLVLLMFAFLFVVTRGFRIARLAPDKFGRLLATGVASWFAFQCLVNLAAMVKLIPLTGVPLPLISYGGSSMIFLLTGLGILVNISRHIEKV